MIIPSVPLERMSTKSGDINDPWRIFFDQLITQLQTFTSDEGYVFPAPKEEDVPKLVAKIGSAIFNPKSASLLMNTDGKHRVVSGYDELDATAIGAIPSGQRNGRLIRNTTTNKVVIGTNDTFEDIT